MKARMAVIFALLAAFWWVKFTINSGGALYLISAVGCTISALLWLVSAAVSRDPR